MIQEIKKTLALIISHLISSVVLCLVMLIIIEYDIYEYHGGIKSIINDCYYFFCGGFMIRFSDLLQLFFRTNNSSNKPCKCTDDLLCEKCLS